MGEAPKDYDQLFDEINDMKDNIDIQNVKMQKEINKLKDEIKIMKVMQKKEIDDQVNEIKKSMQAEYLNQIEKIQKIISQQEIMSMVGKKMNVSTFNSLDGETQKIIIDEIISNEDNNENIKQIGLLLYYLSNEKKRSHSPERNGNYIYFPAQCQNDYNSINKIGISPMMTEILYQNTSINSQSLSNLINNFALFEFQIKYPQPNFDAIYEKIFGLKASKGGKISISIFISGIKITNKTFRNNATINSIILDSTVETIAGSSFCGTFQGCSSLQYCYIPPSVTFIGPYAFRECTSLKQINIPVSVTKIGNFAFSGCTSLKAIIVPTSVIEIGICAFSECTSVKRILIPFAANKIGKTCFSKCPELKELSLPNAADTNETLAIPSQTSVTRI